MDKLCDQLNVMGRNSCGDLAQNRFEPIQEQPQQQQPTKIIDVNDHCLEKIFDYLDSKNLFNVAIANEWLRPAAALTYRRKFGNKRVIVNERFYGEASSKVWSNDAVRIGIKSTLQFLRCFGSTINDLEIDGFVSLNTKCPQTQKINRRHEYIHQYVKMYCAENLLSIRFEWMPNMDYFQGPLVNVENVEIRHGSLDAHLLHVFNDLFPKMRCLKLSDVRMYKDSDAVHFEHLNHLKFRLVCAFSEWKLHRLAQSSPQLRILEIEMHSIMAFSELLKFTEKNRLLTKLSVTFFRGPTSVRPSDVEQLVSQHPFLVELDLPQYKFLSEDARRLFRRINTLKKFRFYCDTSYTEYIRLFSQLDDGWKIEGRTQVTLER